MAETKGTVSFPLAYQNLLVESRQLAPLQVRQFKLLSNHADPEGKDPGLRLLLLLLFASHAKGSVLLSDRKGRGAEDFLLETVALALELLPVESRDSLFEEVDWKDSGTLRNKACELLEPVRTRIRNGEVANWLIARDVALDVRNPVQPWIVARAGGYSLQKWYFGEQAIRRQLQKRLGLLPHENLPGSLQEILVQDPPRTAQGEPLRLHTRQVAAVLVAAMNRTTVISGGPGTGKTTVVTQYLRLLLRLHSGIGSEHMALAAPTGRAAARLQESIAASLGAHPSPIDRPLAQLRGRTLHSLLGYNGHSGAFLHHAGNPLPYKVVVVDETSMIDLHLFGLFLEALDPQCRLVLLGDRDQLPSVEAGAVLGDLTNRAYADVSRGTLSKTMLGTLAPMFAGVSAQEDPTLLARSEGHPFEDHMVVLTYSHRFAGPIGTLASAIATGDLHRVSDALQDSTGQVGVETDSFAQTLQSWAQRHYPPQFLQLAENAFCEESHSSMLASDSEVWMQAQVLLGMHASNRILAPLRQDPHGLEAINAMVSAIIFGDASSTDRAGLPMMVCQNASTLGLFNGDTGVLVQAREGLCLLVRTAQGIRLVPRAVLPRMESAFAMTVHKSQGSEYDSVLLVLPERDSALLTREILFTAITRTRKTFRLLGVNDDLLGRWLRRTIHRESGLMDESP